VSQHATRSTYTWVPQQRWDRQWTDAELYKKYGITEAEQEFIGSLIRPMSPPTGSNE
jgi:site-specific DNA-methyltransferase (adenine-specific)